jgi:hypothetical protein
MDNLKAFAEATQQWLTDHNFLALCTNYEVLAAGQIPYFTEKDVVPTAAVVTSIGDPAHLVELLSAKRIYPPLLAAEVLLAHDATVAQAGEAVQKFILDRWNFLIDTAVPADQRHADLAFTGQNVLQMLYRYPKTDTLVLSRELVGNIWADPDFAELFSPIEKHALATSGVVGKFIVPTPLSDPNWILPNREVSVYSDALLSYTVVPTNTAYLYRRENMHCYAVDAPLRYEPLGLVSEPQINLTTIFGLAAALDPEPAVWFPAQH